MIHQLQKLIQLFDLKIPMLSIMNIATQKDELAESHSFYNNMQLLLINMTSNAVTT